MSFFAIAKIIFIVLLIAVFTIFILNFLIEVTNYFTKLRKKEEALTNLLKRKSLTSPISLESRVRGSASLMDLCDVMIEKEIINTMRTFFVLNKKYELVNLDKDVETIATNVFHALDLEHITTDEITITVEYIIKYITDQTSIKLINTVKEYNAAIQ